ncbi:MAG: peroxiredoxin family protein [Pseudonocardiaceae bacterium]
MTSTGPRTRKPSTKTTKAERRRAAAQAVRSARRSHARRVATRWSVGVAAVVLAIGALYAIYSSGKSPDPGSAGNRAGSLAFQVGSPGPGEPAPDFTLTSTQGDQVSLKDYRGKNVLLYFHEGGGCQPCWTQIGDLEKRAADLKAAGIDEVLTITTDPVNLHARKLSDDGLSSVGLSDPDLAVSQRYTTNQYGMMGTTRNGHSFIVVGSDGTIVWRGDYGGAPDYTMYVPVDTLLADVRSGAKGAS